MLLLTFTVGLLCYQAHGLSQPLIKLNRNPVVSGSDVVLDSGLPFVLTCEGEGPVTLIPRLAKHKRLKNTSGNTCTINVKKVTADFTGSYKCVYTNKTNSNFSSIHVFVRDPRTAFVTPSTSRSIVVKEGDDALLPCLLTDPAATNFQFRMDNGSALPFGMNVTYDPRKGVLIRKLHPGFNADYICSVRVKGVERKSAAFSINVIQRVRFPPYVFLQSSEYVRLVGEKLEIRCSTHNPNFYYNVTWKHSSRELPNPEEKSTSKDDGLAIESVLTLSAVKLTDSGNITCIGINNAGANSSTTQLSVVEEPYLRLYPKFTHKLTPRGFSVDFHEGEDVELGVLIEAYPPITSKWWQFQRFANISKTEGKFFGNQYRYEAVLSIKRIKPSEQGQYTFYASSARAGANMTFQVQMYQKPGAFLKEMNGSSLTCISFGYPAPKILWYQCQGTRQTCIENSTSMEASQLVKAQTVEVQRKEFGAVEVESVLPITQSDKKMTVECVAVNLVGKAVATFPIDQPEKLFTTTLAGAIGVMAFLLLLLIILLYKYKQKPKYEVRWKIIEATDGNNYTFIDPTQLPYNEKWEFPRDKLKLGKVLGAGAFGKVVEATAYGLGKEDNVTRVAVKMLKASAHSDEKEALMSELKILSHLGQHTNIVNLLGACTHGGPVLVITEYCCHGDLLNFLRGQAENFLNCVVTIPDFPETTYKNMINERLFMRSDSGISSTCSDSYLDMRPVGQRTAKSTLGPPCEDEDVGSWPLDMDDLLRFSHQVAEGLEFLAAKNCIHRDVAARNVLLTNSRVAKIGDFGLARDIMNDSNYVVKGNARLPVKWMAPESIFNCVYTVQSDVWSYGILLWEIFSLGKSPYPNIQVDTKFYKMIKSGYQMTRPDFAPPEIYSIMKTCWNLEPTERPTFNKISEFIKKLLGDTPEQTQYQNVQSGTLDEEQLEPCDPAKSSEESCDQEEEEQPLMKANNYQFC